MVISDLHTCKFLGRPGSGLSYLYPQSLTRYLTCSSSSGSACSTTGSQHHTANYLPGPSWLAHRQFWEQPFQNFPFSHSSGLPCLLLWPFTNNPASYLIEKMNKARTPSTSCPFNFNPPLPPLPSSWQSQSARYPFSWVWNLSLPAFHQAHTLIQFL